MTRNTLATIGILAVLLMSLGMVSATSGTTEKFGITMIVSETALTDVTTGDTYDFTVTIANANGTNYNVSFGTSGWEWDREGVTVMNGETEIFIGTLTIGTTQSKSVIAKFHDMTDPTLKLFEIKETVSLSYLPIFGCIDPTANNTDPAANTDDGSCTYDTTPTGDSWCADDFAGEHGHLEIVEFDVINNGKGDDDEWEYLDEIEIEVTVENTGNDNINDVLVEIKIVDEDDNIISKRKMNLNDDEKDLGRIRDGDEETVIFRIDEVPIDLENGEYKIYIRAYDEKNEDTECTSTTSDFTNSDETYFEFSIVSSDKATVIVKEGLDNIQASCGDKDVEVRFMVYNTGSDDEEKVLVMLENSRLGIEEKFVIDNLRDKKGKEAIFYISIPNKVDKSFVELDIYTYYDYDDDEDELDELVAYGESSLDEGDDFSIGLEILSCQPQEATIEINLESKTIVGEQVIIKATVTNNGEDNDFVISTSDLESWAESITISPLTISIDEGESTEIIITFIPTTTGEHAFTVSAISNGQTSSKSALININEKPSLFSGINNTILYTIAGIVVVLILIFITLIVRVSRRQVKPQF